MTVNHRRLKVRSELHYLRELLSLSWCLNPPMGERNYDMHSLANRGLVVWDKTAHGGGGAWVITEAGDYMLERVADLFATSDAVKTDAL